MARLSPHGSRKLESRCDLNLPEPWPFNQWRGSTNPDFPTPRSEGNLATPRTQCGRICADTEFRLRWYVDEMVRSPETFTIVVSGELGAGKTFAAEYFQREHGFEHLSFVDRIWKPILAERGIDPTRAALQELGIELITNVGVDGLVDQLLRSRETDRIVIDDARRTEVLECLRAKLDRLLHIHILAPFDARFPRLVVRDGVQNEDEQRLAEQVSTELTIPALEAIADAVIRNDSSVENYEVQLNGALKEFGFL